MMSDTYQRIQQQSDIEWKYGLAKLIRNMQRTQVILFLHTKMTITNHHPTLGCAIAPQLIFYHFCTDSSKMSQRKRLEKNGQEKVSRNNER